MSKRDIVTEALTLCRKAPRLRNRSLIIALAREVKRLRQRDIKSDPFRGELSVYLHDEFLVGINAPFVRPAVKAIADVLPVGGADLLARAEADPPKEDQ